MKQSVRLALATGTLAVLGGLFLAGTSLAGGGFGPHGHGGMMGPLGHEMLRDVDTNADQALSQEEINAAVNGRFAEFDENSDGTLSLVEFQALFAEITRPISVRAFQFLDPDGDAGIAKAELDDRFGAVVASFDRNDDGVLSRDDRPRHRRFWGGRDGGEQNAEE
jgi:hypothetical protein